MEIRKAKLEDLSAVCRIGYQLSLDMSALEPDYFAVAEQREAPMRRQFYRKIRRSFWQRIWERSLVLPAFGNSRQRRRKTI